MSCSLIIVHKKVCNQKNHELVSDFNNNKWGKIKKSINILFGEFCF